MNKNNYATEVLDVTIDHINDKGLGVAFYRHPAKPGNMGKSLVLFMPNVVPGDEVRVTVHNAKGRKRAYIEFDEILKPGPNRNLANPNKPTIAGGAPLQYMNYDAQLIYKENLVKKYLEKENFDTTRVKPIIGMEKPDHYRNKMDFTFGPNGELGMHQQGNFDNIIDLKESILAPKVMLKIRETVSLWQKDHDLQGYEKTSHQGLLRQLMIRESQATGEIMVILFATEAPENFLAAVNDLVLRLSTKFKNIVSILWIENANISDQMISEEHHVLFGREYINEVLNEFHYKLYFDTFFQVHSTQAERMVATALGMVKEQSDLRVLDLFCGIGTFSLPFAKIAKELVGIELVEQSILSAQENAQNAGLMNTKFFVSDARQDLEKLKESWATPDLLILNPPRSGAGGKLMRSIGRYGSDNIIYISCNPKTLADDLTWLRNFGYQFMEAQPIDQFPHTVHVETVVLLKK